MDPSVSLNKFISDTGYCSRREADRLIEAGRVLLNGELAQSGSRYQPGDEVEVDGSIFKAPKKDTQVYILLNKPAGITTTTERHIPGNIISFVNHPKRIFPVGRLDKDSEGLILLTSDGDIVNKILRAGNRHEKEYLVRVHKPVDKGFVQQMSNGLPILGTTTAPCKVTMMGRQSFRITLTQGLNRQIRRMCEYLGYTVTHLQRVRIMDLRVDQLPLGKWRNLSEAEVTQLKAAISGSDKTATATPKNPRVKKALKPADSPAPAKAPRKKAAAPAAAAPTTKAARGSKIPPAGGGAYKAFREQGRKKRS